MVFRLVGYLHIQVLTRSKFSKMRLSPGKKFVTIFFAQTPILRTTYTILISFEREFDQKSRNFQKMRLSPGNFFGAQMPCHAMPCHAMACHFLIVATRLENVGGAERATASFLIYIYIYIYIYISNLQFETGNVHKHKIVYNK